MGGAVSPLLWPETLCKVLKGHGLGQGQDLGREITRNWLFLLPVHPLMARRGEPPRGGFLFAFDIVFVVTGKKIPSRF